MTTKPRVFVNAAFLCEQVLHEKDGVLSAIRMVDTFGLAVPENAPEGVKPVVKMQLVVNLKAPGFAGAGVLRIQLFGPTKALDPQDVPLNFGGASDGRFTPSDELHTSGVNLNIGLIVGVEKFGNCRIEISWDGEPLTTVPFRLVEALPQVASPPGQPQ